MKLGGNYSPNPISRAVSAHVALAWLASTGRGIDTHLLGSRMMLKEGEGSGCELLGDDLRSEEGVVKRIVMAMGSTVSWRLWNQLRNLLSSPFTRPKPSPSHLHPPMPDLAGPGIVKFDVESKHSCPETSSERSIQGGYCRPHAGDEGGLRARTGRGRGYERKMRHSGAWDASRCFR